MIQGGNHLALRQLGQPARIEQHFPRLRRALEQQRQFIVMAVRLGIQPIVAGKAMQGVEVKARFTQAAARHRTPV